MAMAVSHQQSRDAALLRATTELFALGNQHDADEIRRFEELATHFLGKVSAGDRAFVAERLSKAKDAPPSVLRMLGKDLIEIASPILRRSDTLSEIDLLSILASTGPAHHRQIAQRPDLPAPVVSALRLVGDAETIDLLRGYPEAPAAARRALPPEAPAPARAAVAVAGPAAAPAPKPEPVKATAIPVPATARTPEAREVFAAARAMTAALSFEMESFSSQRPIAKRDAKAEERQEQPAETPVAAVQEETAEAAPVEAALPTAPAEAPSEVAALLAEPVSTSPAEVETIAPEPGPVQLTEFLALDARGRTEALARRCGRVGPADPGMTILDADKAFRIALGSARVSQLARQRQREALLTTLATGLRLDPDSVAAIADDPSGEALVVLLRAIGLSEAETHQVLLFANPVISGAVDTFLRLARLTGEVGGDAARRIANGWREAPRGLPLPSPRPAFADMELRPSLRAEPSRRVETTETERRNAG